MRSVNYLSASISSADTLSGKSRAAAPFLSVSVLLCTLTEAGELESSAESTDGGAEVLSFAGLESGLDCLADFGDIANEGHEARMSTHAVHFGRPLYDSKMSAGRLAAF